MVVPREVIGGPAKPRILVRVQSTTPPFLVVQGRVCYIGGMKITNRHNLPWALVRAAQRDNYSRGESRKSVTQLISPPRIDLLRERHSGEMSTDLVDKIWSMLGSAVHHLLEQGAAEGHTPEERLFTTIGGWVISGQVDVQHDDGVPGIIDYKVTSVWSVMFDKPEWEQQLNAYAYLVWAAKGIKIEKLQICAILRDWRRSDADKDPTYPQQPIQLVDVALWSEDEQAAWLAERVALHQAATTAIEFGEELPRCTDDERWIRASKWAVFKPGGKRATKVVDNEEDARAEAERVGGTVQQRGGEPKRCTGNYCGVRDWCSQWAEDASQRG